MHPRIQAIMDRFESIHLLHLLHLADGLISEIHWVPGKFRTSKERNARYWRKYLVWKYQ